MMGVLVDDCGENAVHALLIAVVATFAGSQYMWAVVETHRGLSFQEHQGLFFTMGNFASSTNESFAMQVTARLVLIQVY